MIRFKITGSDFLELKDGTNINFQYNNSTLNIGNVKLSRSTEFMIPKTPKNESLLLFSSDIAGAGAMMRRKVNAEAHHSSGGYLKGYLSIKSYSKGDYSAIFVYGELEALKKTLEMGNIGTYVTTSEQLTTNSGRATTSAQNASGVLLNNFDFYRYISDVPVSQRFATTINMSPTVKLRYLLAICATATGINLDSTFDSDPVKGMGMVLKGKAKALTAQNLQLIDSPNVSFFEAFGSAVPLFNEITVFDTIANARAMQAISNLTLKFEQIYDAVLNISGNIASSIDEFGNYTIEKGDYKLTAGQWFYVASSENYYLGNLVQPFTYLIDVNVNVVKDFIAGDVELGENYVLSANLPELTFNDLLKTTAGVMLSGLGFDEATNTLSLFDFNYNKANSIEIDGILIEIESVDRTFLDYCRVNEIRFKSEDYVSNDSSIVYSIDNANLSDKKTIYTIPLNDGIKAENGAYIKDFRYENEWKKTAKTDSLVIASKTSENLEHISRIYENFPTILNSKLKTIIENSTTVKVKLRMYLYQFLAITYRTTLKYRGIHYTIYEATYSNGVVSATLIVV